MPIVKIVFLALLFAACDTPANNAHAQRQERVARVPPDAPFDEAWQHVAAGTAAAEDAGVWHVERRKDSAILAYRLLEPVAGRTAKPLVANRQLIATVRKQLAANPAIASHKHAIEIFADSPVVTLAGRVEGPAEAASLVWDALRTPGVSRVVSQLKWPTAPAAR